LNDWKKHKELVEREQVNAVKKEKEELTTINPDNLNIPIDTCVWDKRRWKVYYEGSDIYDALLNQTDITYGIYGNNKFYVIQILVRRNQQEEEEENRELERKKKLAEAQKKKKQPKTIFVKKNKRNCY